MAAPSSPHLISNQFSQRLSNLLGLRTKRLKWNKVLPTLPGMKPPQQPEGFDKGVDFCSRSGVSAQMRQERQARRRGARDPGPSSGGETGGAGRLAGGARVKRFP